ncbi:MAG: hypothetical protein Kow0025_25190 [Thermodesulfovibrionales bacterium]
MTEAKEKKVDEIRKEAEALGCPVRQALYYTEEFLAGPMCGKCFPCALGSYEARVRLANLASGRGSESDLAALQRIAEDMLESSRCKKGKDTAQFILQWLGTEAFREHLEGRCPKKECTELIEFRVVPEKCTMCGICLQACKDHAIQGEKKTPYRSGYLPFEIRQRRCTKCGECVKVCPEGAIVIVDVKSPAEAKV